MPAHRDVPNVPARKERPYVPTMDTTATILERSKRKEPP